MKIILLIWYSNKNFGFRMIDLYLASKSDFKIWKCLISDGTASSCLTIYKEFLSVCSFGGNYVLNLTCLTMNFHDRVHATAYIFRPNGIEDNGQSAVENSRNKPHIFWTASEFIDISWPWFKVASSIRILMYVDYSVPPNTWYTQLTWMKKAHF